MHTMSEVSLFFFTETNRAGVSSLFRWPLFIIHVSPNQPHIRVCPAQVSIAVALKCWNTLSQSIKSGGLEPLDQLGLRQV